MNFQQNLCYDLPMAQRKTQRLGRNSVSAQIATVAAAASDFCVPLPKGVELRTQEEMTIWAQFTRARARSDWRELDLILLAKVVRVEADIRKYQSTLDRIGPIIKNKRETPIVNPLLSVIDSLQRQQLAIIRSMSLNTAPSDPRTLAATAADEEAARQVIKNTGTVLSLIARPS